MDELPKQIWAEVTQSSMLRDHSISVNYNIGGIFGQTAQDQVLATGIWSEVTDVAHDVSNVAGTDPGPPMQLWAPGSEFEDTDGPPRNVVDAYGGTGLRPITTVSVQNLILIQFTVYPSRDPVADGSWEADGVHFDPTRQIEMRAWKKPNSGDQWQLTSSEDFPTSVDYPNDDGDDGGESEEVTAENHVYVVDYPGLVGGVSDMFGRAGYMNFNEFMRVGFGQRPAGENLSGSRASPKYPWHVAHTLEDDPSSTLWKRTTLDNPESQWVNSIGPGHRPNLDP